MEDERSDIVCFDVVGDVFALKGMFCFLLSSGAKASRSGTSTSLYKRARKTMTH